MKRQTDFDKWLIKQHKKYTYLLAICPNASVQIAKAAFYAGRRSKRK